MTKIKVAINGFGRIGRLTTKALLENPNVQIVAVNDVSDAETMAHLFKYDTVHGVFNGEIEVGNNCITINDQVIYLYSSLDPLTLPWKELNIDVVIESTGKFVSRQDSEKHIKAGAKKVIISAPPKDSDIKQIVLGINDHILDKNDTIISNASCTTNCAAPMVKIIHDHFIIQKGIISTVHAYTSDQRLHDAPHKDLRRARAAAHNIIPTSTGASKAIEYIFPNLKGHLLGGSLRVPVISGSITEFTATIEKQATIEQINSLFKNQAQSSLINLLQYTEDPIVSSDIVGNKHSCIFDADLTMVIGNMIRISGWYDNESGYSNRLAELAYKFGTL